MEGREGREKKKRSAYRDEGPITKILNMSLVEDWYITV